MGLPTIRRLARAGLLMSALALAGPVSVTFAQSYDNTNVLVETAVNHIYQKRYQQAHGMLKKAYEQDPRHPGVHFNLGRVFELTGNFSEALKEYQLAAALDPNMVAARRGIARCGVELKRERSMEATNVLNQAAADRSGVREIPRAAPTNQSLPVPPVITQTPVVNRPAPVRLPDAPRVVSLPPMRPSEDLPPTESLRVPPLPTNVVESVSNQPKSEMEGNAEALLDRGKTKDAIDLVQSLLESEPDNPRLHFLLGKGLSLKGDLFGAIKHLEEAIRVDEHFYGAYYLLGQNYAKVNLLDDAMKNYQAFFGVKPQASVAVEMARIYERMGKPGLAEQFYQKANAMNPGNAQIQSRLTASQGEVSHNLYLRANQAFTQSEFSSAVALYQQALVAGGLDDTFRRDAERKLEISRLRAAEIEARERPAKEGLAATRKTYGTVNLHFNELIKVDFNTRFTEPVTVEWRGFVAKSFSRYGRDFLLMIKELNQDELDAMGRDRNDFSLNPNYNNQPVFLLVGEKGTFPAFASAGKYLTFTGRTDWKRYDVLNELGQNVKLPAFEFLSGHP